MGASTAGKIFADLWVDCFCCRNAVPCATADRKAAAKEARRLGFKLTAGGWLCENCRETGRHRRPTLSKETSRHG